VSTKPESNFIAGVHKHIPKSLHHEKMNNPYRGGTADVWYSGARNDLWIEYKFVPKLPKAVDVKTDLSVLQLQWLRGRYEEGRSVAVVIGCPAGGVLLQHLAWERAVPLSTFNDALLTKQQIGAWIYAATNSLVSR
jgi:hypothetical protein